LSVRLVILPNSPVTSISCELVLKFGDVIILILSLFFALEAKAIVAATLLPLPGSDLEKLVKVLSEWH